MCKSKISKKNILNFGYFVLAIFLIIIMFFYIDHYLKIKNSLEKLDLVTPTIENVDKYASVWGTFGDFLGGTINPILTFISIIILVYTIRQNNKALLFNEQELINSSTALTNSSNAQIAMQKTQALQQFDNLFFSLLNNLNLLRDQLINKENEDDINKMYKNCFYRDEIKNSAIICGLVMFNSRLSQYYIYLYQIIKTIIEKIDLIDDLDVLKKEKLKSYYMSLLRANIPLVLLQFLMVNCLAKEFKKFKNLIEKYSFFEHLSFLDLQYEEIRFNLTLISLSSSYKKRVFGDSIFIKPIFSQIFLKNIYDLEKPVTYKMYFNKIMKEVLSFNSIRISLYKEGVNNYLLVVSIIFDYINSSINISDGKDYLAIKFSDVLFFKNGFSFKFKGLNFSILPYEDFFVNLNNNNYKISLLEKNK